MTAVELSKQTNISVRRIQEKAKNAQKNRRALVLNGTSYKVDTVSGSTARGKAYFFSEVKDTKLDIALGKADGRWMLAPEDKKHEAILKAQLVARWEQRERGVGFGAWVKRIPARYEGLKITEASFFRWVKKVRSAKAKGIAPSYALLDNRGGERGCKKISKEMGKRIEEMILSNPDRKIIRVHEYLVDQYGEETPSYATVERYIRHYKENNAFIVEVAADPEKAQSKYRPAFGRMDAGVVYRNQLWELDATPADIITAEGIRLTISAAIDVHSRRVVLVYEETASYTTLGKLFRKAVTQLGVPEAVKTDNGRDYRSNNFEAMCQRFGIEHILVPPYSGYYKPHIERFFRTLSMSLFEELPGYIGHNVAQRQAITSRKSFEGQLEAIARWRVEQKSGSDFAKKWALKKENRGMEIVVPLTRQELEAWTDKWLQTYDQRVHRGISMAPKARWEQSDMPLRHISDVRVLNVLVGASTVKKITKKGIKLHKVLYYAPQMWEYVGQSVIVLSDDDLSQVYVYDSSYAYLFTARNEEYEGMSRAEFLKAGRKFDAKLRKTVKLIEELRREEPALMQSHIVQQLNDKAQLERAAIDTTSEEVGYETKNTVTRAIVEAIEDNGEAVHPEIVDESVVPVINGRPVFDSPFDRFVYEIKHQCVSDKTKKLAEKYKESWEAAVRAAS